MAASGRLARQGYEASEKTLDEFMRKYGLEEQDCARIAGTSSRADAIENAEAAPCNRLALLERESAVISTLGWVESGSGMYFLEWAVRKKFLAHWDNGNIPPV